MPTKHCAFANCTSDSRVRENGVIFVPFAKPGRDRAKCLRWINASRRTDLSIENINLYRYVCSKHFVGGKGPTPLNPDPVPATASKIPKERPSRKNWSQSIKAVPEHRDSESKDESLVDSEETVSTFSTEEPTDYCEENLPLPTHNTHRQTDNEVKKYYEDIIKELQKKINSMKSNTESKLLSLESCKSDPKKFKFYTGLSYQQFTVLWRFLGSPSVTSLQMWLHKSKTHSNFVRRGEHSLTLENQLFLTLLRLRCGFLVQDLSYRFGLSVSTVSKYTATWVQLIYTNFKKINIFPTAEATKAMGLPKAFRKFKNIRVIIDGFEISVQRSKDYRQQGNTYSSYKSRNTVKFLVGIVPTGGCCFLSDGFEGCISDKEIVKKSGLLELLNKQDLILADRGFNIADLCNKIGCSVLIPPFLKGRARLTNQEVRETRDIAAARIHVERFIGRMKEFRILQRTIPKTMLPILSQIVFVIAMLVNFQPPLVE